jgi:hypothetical protein
MKFSQRLRDGSTAVLVVVVLVFAAIGLFVGDAVRRIVLPGRTHTRIERVAVPGPTVTKTVGSAGHVAQQPSRNSHAPQATKNPAPQASSAPSTITRWRTDYQTRNVVVPGPTVTKTVTRVIPGPTHVLRIPLPAVTITVPVPGPTITVSVPPIP